MTICVGAQVSNMSEQTGPRRLRGQTGYVPTWPVAYRAYNLILGSILLVAMAPLIAGFALLLRVVQGPGVLERAKRVGLGGKPFELYRFATVAVSDKPGAFASRRRDPSALGRYLQDTGLDALPHLFNVVKGDMNILGPHPVRRPLAQIEAARDPLYAARFQVKPGLTDHVAATMGPRVSQRMRAKLTYRPCRSAVNLPVEMALLARIAGAYCLRTVQQSLAPFRSRDGQLRKARRRAQDLHLHLETETGIYPIYALSQGLLMTPHVVTGGPAQIHIAAGAGSRSAKVTLDRMSHMQGQTIFQYAPATDYAVHLIARYLRDDVILRPKRPVWRAPRLSDLQYEIALHDAEAMAFVDADKR